MNYLKLVHSSDRSNPNEFDLDVKMLDGSRRWYHKGCLHRVGAPAIYKRNGDKEWYQMGLRHNTQGPAVTLVNGTKEWWLFGLQLTESEYNNEQH